MWKENSKVKIIHLLDDIGQPYSCSTWGNTGNTEIPPIVDDGTGYTVYDWFNNPGEAGSYPLIIFIDHTMTVYYKSNNISYSTANNKIQQMLFLNCNNYRYSF